MKYKGLIIILIIMSLYPVLSPVESQNTKGTIIIHTGHTTYDIQNILGPLANQLIAAGYTIQFGKTLELTGYDILVIAIPTVPFAGFELDAIHTFVRNGGGLLLLGESGILSTKNVADFNELAGYYNIEFQRDMVVDPENNLVLDQSYAEIPLIENFADHLVTRDIKRIFFAFGCSLRISGNATALAWGGPDTYGDRILGAYDFRGGTYEASIEKIGKDLTLMACTESGQGKVLAIGDTSLFRGTYSLGGLWPQEPLEYYDHKRLALNIFYWLSLDIDTERSIQSVNTAIERARNFIDNGEYQKAYDLLARVKPLALELEDSYLQRQIASVTEIANKGMKADSLLAQGKQKIDTSCEEAYSDIEDAMEIYTEIGNEEKIQECIALLVECEDQEVLLRADTLVMEANDLTKRKEYVKAVETLEEARKIYEQGENQEKVQEVDAYIEEIGELQKKEQQETQIIERNRVILVVVVILVSVLVTGIYMWRRYFY
jgi:tetratricopeptide (TPR) repeat protein